ncbi:hypothetical protein VUR80DRAFT_10297 [Thermomyces stellatus]
MRIGQRKPSPLRGRWAQTRLWGLHCDELAGNSKGCPSGFWEVNASNSYEQARRFVIVRNSEESNCPKLHGRGVRPNPPLSRYRQCSASKPSLPGTQYRATECS